MKIKKYIAKSMPEAMKLIRSELGDAAVILNSKEVETGGFLGFFTNKQLEVIVAIDPVAKQSIQQPKQQQKRVPKPAISTIQPKDENLIEEINELKQLVHGLNDRLKSSGASQASEYPKPFQNIDDHLRSQGVSEEIRLQLMKHLLKKWYEQTITEKDVEDLLLELDSYVDELLKSIPMGGITFDKKIVNIVGPTGVGKTTTIAKIAALCVLKKHKKVALITTDTYRIAAVEQLKTYAKILNIPLEVAYSLEDFKNALEQFSHYDLILVDSAGRNYRNRLYVEELSKIIDFDHQVETFLTLSLTSKYEDMKDILQQFSVIPINKVILTKTDETSSLGAMLNIPLELGKGIAYVTNGQNVPDDLIECSTTYIKQSVMAVVSDE